MPLSILCGAALSAGFAASVVSGDKRKSIQADVVVYGGSSAGVMAAVQAARGGKSVVLIAPSGHLGGMSSAGLGQTDVGKLEVIGGLNAEFYARIAAWYDAPAHWTRETREQWLVKESWGHKTYKNMMFKFEPHVAEQTFGDMVREQLRIRLMTGERLDRYRQVVKKGARIESIFMESGLEIEGKVFLDCTYEGDLMAASGVSFALGRESNAAYGETLDGVQLGMVGHRMPKGVSPYRIEGDPSSGLLPGILPAPPGKTGDGDKRIQAYCFRLCLTNDPANRMPFPRPEGYDRKNYELLRRAMAKGAYTNLGNSQPMPNRKTDTNNNGGVSSDYIGMSYDWPVATYEERERIFEAHKRYQMGLWYYLTQDPETPAEIRKRYDEWGLAKDEFTQTGGWPHELYVREGRRMVGQLVMTERHCTGVDKVADPIAHGGFNMDSHHTCRYVDADGDVQNEGDVQKDSAAYAISYRAITPKATECANLLVPVCLSASHIAYGSIRMEPVFMSLGQAAGLAAALAIDHRCAVQQVRYSWLRRELERNGQIQASVSGR